MTKLQNIAKKSELIQLPSLFGKINVWTIIELPRNISFWNAMKWAIQYNTFTNICRIVQCSFMTFQSYKNKENKRSKMHYCFV